MPALSDSDIDAIARQLIEILKATGSTTDADRMAALKRAEKIMTEAAAGRALCVRCHMLVPIEAGAHLAACGLPCAGERRPTLVHYDFDDCPLCHGELGSRIRKVLIV